MFRYFRPIATASRLTQFFALMLMLALFALQGAGQGGTSLRGVVEDPSGSAVPGAKLTLISKANGEARVAESDSNGRFLFENVSSGGYILKAQADEFRPFEKDVTIGAGPLEV